jgi:hypothetical protein
MTTPTTDIKTKKLTGFIYKGELFIRVIPVKALFNSNLIHGATVRGDIFAMRVSDQALTIVPGKADVVHVEARAFWNQAAPAQQELALEKLALTP